jgi:hypothetical protein
VPRSGRNERANHSQAGGERRSTHCGQFDRWQPAVADFIRYFCKLIWIIAGFDPAIQSM